jgi:maleate isomerase
MARPRVGLLIPSSNTVMERDFHRELDPLGEVHTARMYMVDTTREGEQRMLEDEALPAAQRVATVEPDLIVFGCTSASSLHGRDYDDAFRGRLAEMTGVPVMGVLSSVLEELEGCGRVALFTPYNEELTGTIAASLEAGGVEVVARRGLGIERNVEIGDLAPEDIVREVRTMDLQDADAVFCSCTNLRAYEARDVLATAVGRPVFTSNQAVVSRLRARLGLAVVSGR